MHRSIRPTLPTWLLFITALALILPALGPTQATAQARFAELRVLAGKAEVQRDSQRYALKSGQRMTLRHSDNIRTFAASKVYLRMVQSSAEAIITADTSIRAGELSRDGRPRDLLTVLYGGLRMRVKRWLGTDKPVQAGVATIGIKGTDFVTLVKRKQAAYGSGGSASTARDSKGDDGAATTEGLVQSTEFIGIEGTIEAVNQQRPEFRLTIGHRQWGEMLPDKPPAPPIRVPDEIWFSALETFSFSLPRP